MDRRGFLGSILAAAVAPAIVRADSLMRIIPRETNVLWDSPANELWLNGQLVGRVESIALQCGDTLRGSGFTGDAAELNDKNLRVGRARTFENDFLDLIYRGENMPLYVSLHTVDPMDHAGDALGYRRYARARIA